MIQNLDSWKKLKILFVAAFCAATVACTNSSDKATTAASNLIPAVDTNCGSSPCVK